MGNLTACGSIRRTAADPSLLSGPLGEELARLDDPELPLYNVPALRQIVNECDPEPCLSAGSSHEPARRRFAWPKLAEGIEPDVKAPYAEALDRAVKEIIG